MEFKDEPKGSKGLKEHYMEYFGELYFPIAHAGDGEVPHIAAHQFEPNEENDFWTLITSGMSDVRQCAPDDTPENIAKRTELIKFVDEPEEWMIRFLIGIAHFPFVEQVILHQGVATYGKSNS
jgi:hypothetical protein